MSLSSSSSDSDRDEDREILNRILAKSGKSPIQIPNDVDSDSDNSSGSNVQDWFRQLQEKFSLTSADADSIPKPLNVRVPESDSDDDDEDVAEMMATIHRRFDQYQNVALKEQSRLQEAGMAVTDITSGTERTDASSKNIKILDQLPDPGFSVSHQSVDESCNLSVKALTYSQFPKSAQNFVDALKKNRLCQRFIRKKLMEIEAKIEENKKLKERIKCLMDFQLACKRKVGHILCQKKDPRVRLISTQKPRKSKTMKIDNYVKTGMTIGLGSGPASNFAIQHLGHKLREGSLTNILGIPTSISSAVEAEKAGITIDKLILHSSMLMLLRRGLWLQ